MPRKWSDEDEALRDAAMARLREQYERLSASRPFIMMQAVGDSRDHPVCTAIDEIVAHGMTEWAIKNWPPHHHACRCTVRTLSQRQIDREGLTVTHKE